MILHRDLLLPYGYIHLEESSDSIQKMVTRRPGTCAKPAVGEEASSDEGNDALIPV